MATGVVSAACGSGRTNPAAPSQHADAIGFGTISVQSVASCFHFAGDPACFSGARLTRLAASPAAAPPAPSGLSASVSGSTVVLSWSAAAGAPTTYIVEAGSTPGAANLANFDLGGTATTLTATGVGAGMYYVRVRARNACGTGAASNEVTVVIATSGSGINGRWLGLAANGDGVIWAPQSDVCDSLDDLQLDLTAAGTALSGTFTMTTRAVKRSNCTPVGGSTPITGTFDGTRVSFSLGRATVTGTVSGNRMSGVFIGSGDGSQVATFTVIRQ